MRIITVNRNDAGQRLDRFLMKAVPALPPGLRSKYIRTKAVKLNGKRTEASARIAEGDEIALYINDEFFMTSSDDASFTLVSRPPAILYEDGEILLAVKEPGLSVHEDESGNPDTLINRIKSYCVRTGAWEPEKENSFAPALANRIDRNTGGIVIACKSAEALREMNALIRDRKIDKYYLAAVCGDPPPAGTLKGYIRKRESENRVDVFDSPAPGARTAVTGFRVLAREDGLALCECRLFTGRTHQIRAQMAHAGFPLLGDGKYGRADPRQKHQALYSYKLIFSDVPEDSPLHYLKGRVFVWQDVDFLKEFFPGYYSAQKKKRSD
ncbi:MAG: RluA family pseudouridine synthase [Clostridia bacterium]|nr:RluA family pseudouridine synthase [Clostridia bacterium]